MIHRRNNNRRGARGRPYCSTCPRLNAAAAPRVATRVATRARRPGRRAALLDRAGRLLAWAALRLQRTARRLWDASHYPGGGSGSRGQRPR